jgi:hypothetical protein
MYRKSSKQKEIIQRTALYVFMTLSVLVIVSGLVFAILGYRFDSENGRVEQGSLLQFNTIPSGATIEIDGKAISAKTPAKSTTTAGDHQFVMRRDGYETWQKSLTVAAGTLTWLDYARLVPKERPVVAVAAYETITASRATVDGDAMLIQESKTTPSFQLVDLTSDTVQTTTLTLPETLYSEATTPDVSHTFNIDQWDRGGRYVLIEHTYADKKEWLVLDTRDTAASRNITTQLRIGIDSVVFSGTSGNILYGLSAGTIRKIDLSADTISGALVSNVTRFELFETNIITYVGTDQTDPTKRVAGLYREGDETPHVLRTTTSAADVPLYIATSRYFNESIIAITEGNQVEILSGDYPRSGSADNSSLKAYGAFTFVAGIDALSFSPAGDYVLVQSGINFASFDIERKMVHTSVLVSDGAVAVSPLTWLDDDHVWHDAGSKLVMREFDGANSTTINNSVISQDVTLTPNDRYMYSIGKTADGYQLQRVRMVL